MGLLRSQFDMFSKAFNISSFSLPSVPLVEEARQLTVPNKMDKEIKYFFSARLVRHHCRLETQRQHINDRFITQNELNHHHVYKLTKLSNVYSLG